MASAEAAGAADRMMSQPENTADKELVLGLSAPHPCQHALPVEEGSAIGLMMEETDAGDRRGPSTSAVPSAPADPDPGVSLMSSTLTERTEGEKKRKTPEALPAPDMQTAGTEPVVVETGEPEGDMQGTPATPSGMVSRCCRSCGVSLMPHEAAFVVAGGQPGATPPPNAPPGLPPLGMGLVASTRMDTFGELLQEVSNLEGSAPAATSDGTTTVDSNNLLAGTGAGTYQRVDCLPGLPKKKVRFNPKKPPKERKEPVHHWPVPMEKRANCKMCAVEASANKRSKDASRCSLMCEHCGVPLCLKHFKEYHVIDDFMRVLEVTNSKGEKEAQMADGEEMEAGVMVSEAEVGGTDSTGPSGGGDTGSGGDVAEATDLVAAEQGAEEMASENKSCDQRLYAHLGGHD